MYKFHKLLEIVLIIIDIINGLLELLKFL